MSRSEAERWRDQFKAQIRAGEFVDPTKPKPQDFHMAVGDLASHYLDQHVRMPTRRPTGRAYMELQVSVIRRTQVDVPGGQVRFEEVPLDHVNAPMIEALRRQFIKRKPRAKGGGAGANRLLSRTRHMFNWGVEQGYTDHTPFKRHGVTVVRLDGRAEAPRHRRLEPGEEEALIAAANPRLQALIIAALETGMRLGELLLLQWRDIRAGVILLPPEKTKTNESRPIPMTRRLGAVLEMRRHDPTGELFGPDGYVFGNEVGEQVRSIRTAWENCRRRANVEGLHFHDLRREFASRLLESPGVALHDVAQWVGHASVVTTTRYLATTGVRQREVLKRFERRHQSQQAAESSPAVQGALETS